LKELRVAGVDTVGPFPVFLEQTIELTHYCFLKESVY
jgi:hypothetical protein